MLSKTSLLILLNAPSWALKHVFVLGLTIKEAEVEKCITCVSFGDEVGGGFTFSWLDGSCASDRDCGERSDRCCSDVGCCTEDGCRAPNDSFSMGAIADVSSTTATAKSTQSCAQCCDEVVSGTDTDCHVRSWAPDQASTANETSWYNSEAIGDEGICQASSCPPCAVCSLKTEAEMRGLAAEAQATVFLKIYCTEHICNDLKDVVYKEDPCKMTPDSCSCFCYKANNLLDSCPHLGNVLYPPDDWKDTAQTQAGSSSANRIASTAMYPLYLGIFQMIFVFLA